MKPVRAAISHALGSSGVEQVVAGPGSALGSVYDVSGLAAATIGAAASEIAALLAETSAVDHEVVVDQRLASMWFGTTVTPIDFELPPLWDPVAGDYQCADGWIRLHTNAPHHRQAAMGVLGTPPVREVVADEVRRWTGAELEATIVSHHGCAAQMRSVAEWKRHPQGRAVGAEPLIDWSGDPAPWAPNRSDRPLDGLRVLDLTRVLAGPACTRFLAGWGASVLRIDPPGWDEPGLVPDMTLGKRCARLDLRAERDRFEWLLGEAHVVVHGYRPGALAGLGYERFDGVVDVALDAYGWTGPWARRRGFDSLVQMSAGLAAEGMRAYRADRPAPLPVQALDHATGYLMAAAAIRALRGGPSRARVSLARTAALLIEHPGDPHATFEPAGSWTTEMTAWGTLHRTAAPVRVGPLRMRWDHPAGPLGSHRPSW